MSKGVQLKDNTGEKVYPRPYYAVGDLYLTTNTTNPNLLFGGVWQLFGPGRCLVCVNSSDSVLNASNKTGGSINPLTNHNHSIAGNYMRDTGVSGAWGSAIVQTSGYTAQPSGVSINNNGDNTNHNNWQPFITCYVWLRTA